MADIKPAQSGVPTDASINTVVPIVSANPMDASRSPEILIGRVGAGVVNTMLYVAGGLTIIYIIYAGSQFIVAQGDSGKVEAAKHKLLNAILGIVVITLSLFIVRMIVAAISGVPVAVVS